MSQFDQKIAFLEETLSIIDTQIAAAKKVENAKLVAVLLEKENRLRKQIQELEHFDHSGKEFV